MVILLSFLSSTEQQQNNVITVAALAKVLTSFPYPVQFLEAVETRVSYKDSCGGLYVYIWFLIHSRSRATLEWWFAGYSSVAATLRAIKIWGQNWTRTRGFGKKIFFSKDSPDDNNKGLNSGSPMTCQGLNQCFAFTFSVSTALWGRKSLPSLHKLKLCEAKYHMPF